MYVSHPRPTLALLTAAIAALLVIPTVGVTAVSAPVASTSSSCPVEAVPVAAFSDVPPEGTAHSTAIACVHWWELMQGTTSTTFSPGTSISRGQFTTLLANLLERVGADVPEVASAAFVDVRGTVHEGAIATLSDAGVIFGITEEVFLPGRPITRGQLASLLARVHRDVLAQGLPTTGGDFTDIQGDVHEASIRSMASLGVATGLGDGTYGSSSPLSRAQAASFVARYLDVLTSAGLASLPAPSQGISGLGTRRNLLTEAQANFESADLGWTSQGNTDLQRTESKSFNGAGSLQVTVERDEYADASRTARAGTPQYSSALNAEAGRSYEAGFRVAPSGVPSAVRCELRWYDTDSRILRTDEGPFVTEIAGKWVEPTCRAIAPPGTARVALRTFVLNADYGDVHYLDAAWLAVAASTTEPTPAPTPDPPPSSPEPGGPAPTDVEHGEDLTVDNTGYVGRGLSASELVASGSIRTTRSGQVIERVNVRGAITVLHDNVTIRDCVVDYRGKTSGYAIDLGSSSGTVIDHCEIIGDSDRTAGVAGGQYILRWNNIHGFRVGAHLRSGARAEYNYVWGELSGPGVHGNSMVTNGGSDIVVYRNNLEGSSSSALSLYSDFAPVQRVRVEGNLFNGDSSSYCFYGTADKTHSGSARDVRVTDNLFGTKFSAKCGQYGTHTDWDGGAPGAVWCRNRWQSTGQTVGKDVGCG